MMPYSHQVKTKHGHVRSTDAFDSHDLVLFRVTTNYKTDNRGEVERDDYDDPIISNYQFNFVQQSKSGDVGNDDNIVRILFDSTESKRLQTGLKQEDKLVPQGLKIAEFSKISDISVYTLRYYDRLNILKPLSVNETNGYREYSSEQLLRVTEINSLKELGLTIKDMAYFFANDSHDAQKIREIADKQVKELRKVINQTEQQISFIIKG